MVGNCACLAHWSSATIEERIFPQRDVTTASVCVHKCFHSSENFLFHSQRLGRGREMSRVWSGNAFRFAFCENLFWDRNKVDGHSPTPSRIFSRWRWILYARQRKTLFSCFMRRVLTESLNCKLNSRVLRILDDDEAVRRRNWMRFARKSEFHGDRKVVWSESVTDLITVYAKLHASDSWWGDKSFHSRLNAYDRRDSCQFMEIGCLRRLSMAWKDFIRHSDGEVTRRLIRFSRTGWKLFSLESLEPATCQSILSSEFDFSSVFTGKNVLRVVSTFQHVRSAERGKWCEKIFCRFTRNNWINRPFAPPLSF